MNYLRNVWYVAAWADEIGCGQSVARTVLGQDVVLFRSAAGKCSALVNRCSHRFAPLHLGKVVGDTLECAYHGLRFDGSGVCTFNPHGNGAVPKAAHLRSFPLVERHRLLWIWMGDADKADTSLVPDFSSLDAENWYVGADYLHVKSNYQLDVDNIMDLSHIDFLHATSLGGAIAKEVETEVVQNGNTVFSLRLTRNEQLSPELERRNGLQPGTLVDRWLDVRWEPPGVMELQVGLAPAGASNPREIGKVRYFQHLFTPETETTSHYWFATSLPKAAGPQGEDIVRDVIKFLRAPFETEDLPMLEAQQGAMKGHGFWELKPVLLPTDAGSVRARRVLDALIEAESKQLLAEKVESSAPVR